MKNLSLVVLAVVLVVTACSSGPEVPEQLQPYMQAQAVPGEGLSPDLTIGELTLSRAVEKFGAGQPSQTWSDTQVGFEYTYARQIRLSFVSDKLCMSEIRMVSPRKIHALMTKPEKFFQTYAECASARLSSIRIADGYVRDKTIYQGSLPSGITLFDTLETAMQKDPALERVKPGREDLVGVENPNPRTDEMACREGIKEMCPTVQIPGKARLEKDGVELLFKLDKKEYDGRLVLKAITILPAS